MDYPRYDPQSAVTPLTATELQTLDTLLQNLPADGVMSLDGLDGYLTALLVGPPQVLAEFDTAEWLPLVWGGDLATAAEAAPFASKRQRKATVVLVLRHLRHIAHQLTEAVQAWEPIFSIAEQGAREFADARDWCTGFMQAVDLLPSAWEGAWGDPQVAPLLALGGGLEPTTPSPAQNIDDPAECDALSRAVPDAVLHLLARQVPPKPRPSTSSTSAAKSALPDDAAGL